MTINIHPSTPSFTVEPPRPPRPPHRSSSSLLLASCFFHPFPHPLSSSFPPSHMLTTAHNAMAPPPPPPPSATHAAPGAVSSAFDEEVLMHQSPAFHIRNLPLVTVNHISFAVPYPKLTASFFVKVLGFQELNRPPFLDTVDGAWICGLGIELHFIEKKADNLVSRPLTRFPSSLCDDPIDTRNDHLSFLSADHFDAIVDVLKSFTVKYVVRKFPGEDLRQVSEHAPFRQTLFGKCKLISWRAAATPDVH